MTVQPPVSRRCLLDETFPKGSEYVRGYQLFSLLINQYIVSFLKNT